MDGQPDIFNDRLRLRIVAPKGDSRMAVTMRTLVERLNTSRESGTCQQFILQALMEKVERDLYGSSGALKEQVVQSHGTGMPMPAPQFSGQATYSHPSAGENNQRFASERTSDKPSLNAMDDGDDSHDQGLPVHHTPLGSSFSQHESNAFSVPVVSERGGSKLPAAALDIMG